jgi:pimeloyl-ACP methyl ester carboxylesterase
LARRGLGFFRCNKRGCAIVEDEEGFPREISNRSVFSKATPDVLLADYQAALRALQTQPGVDPNRIFLLGASEGTRIAPRLARLEPRLVVGLALFGYAEDNTRDTLEWQHTRGPWRNVARLFDGNRDGRVTRSEYDAVAGSNAWLAAQVPFDPMDRNRDHVLTPDDLDHHARFEQIAKAVRQHDDAFLWDNVVNLTSAYLASDWTAPPTHRSLLELEIPIGIFHGEADGTCRVEGAIETEQAFRRAGRTNLTVRIYPGADHDLNWPQFLRQGRAPPPSPTCSTSSRRA